MVEFSFVLMTVDIRNTTEIVKARSWGITIGAREASIASMEMYSPTFVRCAQSIQRQGAMLLTTNLQKDRNQIDHSQTGRRPSEYTVVGRFCF